MNVKWGAAPTSRGTVLSTELQNIANQAFTAAGAAYDNTANLDRWGWVEYLAAATATPTAGATLSVYLVTSLDGSNYDDAASSTNPATHQLVAVIAVQASAHTVRANSGPAPFPLPPTKFKFVVKNQTGVATPNNAGNTLTLFTANEAVA